MQRPVSSRHAPAIFPGQNAGSKNKARVLAEQQAAVSAYISDISAELARMAGEAQLPMLAYFLNLARVEAEISQREKDSED
jgi:hypothetical protein